jgi:hypothetical protein
MFLQENESTSIPTHIIRYWGGKLFRDDANRNRLCRGVFA